jgi:hypothetical protein
LMPRPGRVSPAARQAFELEFGFMRLPPYWYFP